MEALPESPVENLETDDLYNARSRYTRFAVPPNSSAISASVAFRACAIRLNAFHITV